MPGVESLTGPQCLRSPQEGQTGLRKVRQASGSYSKHYFLTTRTASSMAELFVDINSTTGARIEHDKTVPDMLFIVNFDWLNGLSPANIRPDVPVAIRFNNETPWGRCVHWSEGLWDKFPTS
ncbi:hypothetical protein ACOMHN_058638 [Nucella lapillus]